MFYKKIFISIILGLAVINLFSFSVYPANAAGISDEIGKQLGAAAGEKGAGFDAPKDPRTIIMQIVRIALTFIGTLFLVLTLYAGYLWMTAAGNDDQVIKAKTLLMQATIGLGVILMAYSITYLAIKLASGDLENQDSGVYIIPTPPTTNPAMY